MDLKVFENNKDVADKLVTELNETKVRMATYNKRGKQYIANIQELKETLKPLREVQHKLGSFETRRKVANLKIQNLKQQVLQCMAI